MRDAERIEPFCQELARLWVTYVPDWRFGQLISNLFGHIVGNGRDPFFPEEDEMIRTIASYFGEDTTNTKPVTGE